MGHLDTHLREHPELRDKLRSNSIVAGIAGNLAEQRQAILKEQQELEAAKAAATAKEQELLDLAENDPEEFAARFRTQAQADKAKAELENLRAKEEQRIAGHIGLAVRDLPELQTLDLSEQRKIADALARVPSDQVLGVYTRTVIDIAAHRRALALAEAQFPTRLEAEKQAWTAQQNAVRIRNGAAPNLGVAARTPASDEPDFRADPMGYIKWAETQRRLSR